MKLKFNPNDRIKRIIAEIGVTVVGIAAVGVFGTAVLGGFPSAKSAVAVNEKAISEQAAKTTPATKVVTFVKFKKAPVNEYDMVGVSKSVTGDSSESASKKSNTPNDFEVEFPQDTQTVLDVMPSSSPLYSTRSVAGEYYTVYDERSGKTVTVNGHELLCQLVNSEISGNWGVEAIKAQVVAAYTYLRFNDARGAVATVGMKSGYSSKIEQCVSAVEGQTVCYNGSIIDAVYSASTAGRTNSSQSIWGVSYPYLQSVVSKYDSKDPHWNVKTTVSKEKVKKILEAKIGMKLSDNPMKWFNITSFHGGKYIGTVLIDGKKTLTGYNLCDMFDVISNAMSISYKDGIFTFASYGWGHGVGMSQWGSYFYAQAGYSYDQILRHYYVNTNITVSTVNAKAVARASMTEKELEEEAAKETIVTDNSSNGGKNNAVEANATVTTTTAKVTKKAEAVTTSAPKQTTVQEKTTSVTNSTTTETTVTEQPSENSEADEMTKY